MEIATENKVNDWYLSWLINLVNKSNEPISFGITIVTHGFLVSGQLVGGKEYFELFAEDFTQSESELSIVKDRINGFGNVYDSKENVENEELPMFIHLKDAKFFQTSGNPIPANHGVLWRGRISEVSGFTLGALGAK